MVVDPQCAGIRKLQKKAPGVSTQNFITIHHIFLTSSLVIYYIGINAHYREKLKLIVRQKTSRIVK